MQPQPARFLAVWAGDADRREDDFLAIIDVRAESPTFGHVLSTVTVGSKGNEPHHIDFALRLDGTLWASGILSGRTFIFDVSHAPDASLLWVDEPTPERVHTPPHAYARLPDGHTLATAMDMMVGHQMGAAPKVGGDAAPGGLLEFDAHGTYLRRISAADPRAKTAVISPYGIAIKPEWNLMVTTNATHGWLPTSKEMLPGNSIQVWRISDRGLLKTVPFEAGPRGRENTAPYEPRFLHAPRSRTVLINSVLGGALYVSRDIGQSEPRVELVYDFGADSVPAYPMITQNDRFYLQPLTEANKVVVLDIRDPLHPRQVSEARFDRDPGDPGVKRQGQPHYLALDRNERRMAVSDYVMEIPSLLADGDRRVYLLTLDPETGAIDFDRRFRDETTGRVGVEFDREVWPHGKTGAARPHGMLFLP
ncbi:MAG: selenium-binding protein SBP56-related protein [Steroidobacteraceae bacterium]